MFCEKGKDSNGAAEAGVPLKINYLFIPIFIYYSFNKKGDR